MLNNDVFKKLNLNDTENNTIQYYNLQFQKSAFLREKFLKQNKK